MRTILFGITGGIGSGKTTIARALEQLGYKVYYTDRSARQIMEQNPCVRSQIELLFGSDIYAGDCLDRQEVALQVFNDRRLLERLNGIVHPAVRFDLEQWKKEQSGICFVESAILFESRLNEICDGVINIASPQEVRIKRVAARDKMSPEEIESRINNQMTDQERLRLSDITIINDEQSKISNIIEQIQEYCHRQEKEDICQ